LNESATLKKSGRFFQIVAAATRPAQDAVTAGFPQTWKTWKSRGISPKVRELFEAGLSSKANHPRLLKWTYAG